MPLSGDVRINQDGVIPSVLDLANADAFAVAMVDTAGNQLAGFDQSRPANAALTSVPYAAGSQSVLAANVARRGVMLHNPTNKVVNIALAAVASLTSYSFQLPSGGTYESALNGYTGDITAIWLSAPSAGPTLHVTEITT